MPLASSSAVLNAVVASGSRGWLGGGHNPGAVAPRTMTNAEMKPANSITSTNTASAMPNRAFSANRPRGASMLRMRSVTLGSMAALCSPGFRSSLLRQLVEFGAFLPVAAILLHHVGRHACEQQHHEHQDHGEQPPDDRLFDVEMHEVLRHHVSLHQRHAEGGDERDHADPR